MTPEAITISLDLDGMHVSCAEETRHFTVEPLDENNDEHAEVMINLALWSELEREK